MKTQQAFSLIEVMITLIVAAILASVALPNMQYMLLNNRITSKTNEFISAINYVRNETITRPGRPLRIQPSNNGWSNGWQIVDDSKGDGWQFVSDTEELLKIFEYKGEANLIVIKKTKGKCGNDHDICYKSRGRIQETYEFFVCHPEFAEGRIIKIKPVGRVSTERCSLNGGAEPCSETCTT